LTSPRRHRGAGVVAIDPAVVKLAADAKPAAAIFRADDAAQVQQVVGVVETGSRLSVDAFVTKPHAAGDGQPVLGKSGTRQREQKGKGEISQANLLISGHRRQTGNA